MFSKGDVVRVNNPYDKYFGEIAMIISESAFGYNVKLDGGSCTKYDEVELILVFRRLS